MKKVIQPVKGTRDFYPDEMALRTWLYAQIRDVSESYGYQEYEGPFLESIYLYAAKSGEALVKEQAFVFPDRGGNQITLRPELTPSLARMIAQKQNQLVFPLRWWSFGPFWRYERPQKGRTREFFQWNADLMGVDLPEADAELVSVCASLFEKISLKPDEVKILVNDRRLMEKEISALQIPSERRIDVFHLIDRKEKLSISEWEKYVFDQGFNRKQLEGLQELVANKKLYQKSDDLMRFFEAVASLGCEDYVVYDPSIIRGLDYYTGIVFEAKDIDKEGRAILGGGHYANLVADVGGEPLPGVGFAMGDVVLLLVLEKYGKLPNLDCMPASVLVTVFDEGSLSRSYALAASLRGAGFNVVCYPQATKLAKQLKFADKMGCKFAIIQGPDELQENSVIVKNLKEREQITVKRDQLTSELRSFLAEV
ncbi:MAG TPA: histidine--tRNA ligase [Anaerolineae bacterium]|nr:histidine--tRNA ligase [Anaerolineae bacterium]